MSNALADMATGPASGPARVIAVQSIEDPFYFGLFAALLVELRRRFDVRSEIVFVHSISSAMGTGPWAALVRSVLMRWPVSRQWWRAFAPLGAGVAYRSVSLRRPIGDLLDLFRSEWIWRRLRRQSGDFALDIDGVPVGDLIVDSYLRFRPCPRFDRADPFVKRLIWQAHRDVRRARAYFCSRPSCYLTSYSTYIEHGIPVRVALQSNVPVWSFGGMLKIGKKLTLQDWFHTPNADNYRRRFESLGDQEARLEEAHAQLRKRFSGKNDIAMGYMRVSAYAGTDEALPPGLSRAVVVFMHDFYDSPHIYHNLVFEDFWAWICFTIETLAHTGVPFFLKPHPNQVALSDAVLGELKARYPQVVFLSTSVTNAQLASAGIKCGVTMYGSVAHELAYFGLPSIACARHPHASFDFCRTARTRDQYREYLESPGVMPVDAVEMRRQALAFYYMHNLDLDDERRQMRERFVAYWKACQPADNPAEAIMAALRSLMDTRAFVALAAEIASGEAPLVATRHPINA